MQVQKSGHLKTMYSEKHKYSIVLDKMDQLSFPLKIFSHTLSGMSQDDAMSDYINLGNEVISKYGT